MHNVRTNMSEFKHVRWRASVSVMQSHCRRQKIRKEIRGCRGGIENGIPARRGKICPDFTETISVFFIGRILRRFIFPQTAGAAAAQFPRLIHRSFSGQRRETRA